MLTFFVNTDQATKPSLVTTRVRNDVECRVCSDRRIVHLNSSCNDQSVGICTGCLYPSVACSSEIQCRRSSRNVYSTLNRSTDKFHFSTYENETPSSTGSSNALECVHTVCIDSLSYGNSHSMSTLCHFQNRIFRRNACRVDRTGHIHLTLHTITYECPAHHVCLSTCHVYSLTFCTVNSECEAESICISEVFNSLEYYRCIAQSGSNGSCGTSSFCFNLHHKASLFACVGKGK